MAARKPQTTLDSRAIEIACRTEGKHERHEDECTKRYGVLAEQFVKVFEKFDEQDIHRAESMRRLYALLWAMVAGLVLILISVIGFLSAQLLTRVH